MSLRDSMRIAFVPLDDRPACYDQVGTLAEIAGIQLRHPPRSLIGSHQPHFDHLGLHDWLDSQLSEVDAAVISVDLYVYGGLIHCRNLRVKPEEALARINRLLGLLQKHSRVRFYLSSVLLRLSVTVDASHGEQVWKDVFEYVVQADGGDPLILKWLAERIPSSVLEEFLGARRRNHAVNLALIKAAPYVGSVIYGQEDCAERGMHRLEKIKLREALRQLPVNEANKFEIMTGADELGALLIMRAYLEFSGMGVEQQPLFFALSSSDALQGISKYEDISVEENLKLHFAGSPFHLVPASQRKSDSRLSTLRILGFAPHAQGDLCFENQRKTDPAAVQFANQVNAGDPVLDLSYGNGGNQIFLENLLQRLGWKALGAYSAWNTTGNRLGTLAAHLGLCETARDRGSWDEQADRRYLMVRLLDEGVYQGIVRATLQAEALQAGDNPWALSQSRWEYFTRRTRELMKREAHRLGLDLPFNSHLPWPRLFEVLNVLE